mgnify:CR=1 FL=1
MFLYEEDVVLDKSGYKGKKYAKPMGPGAPHYRNKQERKELARLAQDAGEPVEKLLKNKDIRVKLALARKSANPISDHNFRHKLVSKRVKRIASELTKLPVWHEDVQKVWQQYWNEYRAYPWRMPKYPSQATVHCILTDLGIPLA